VAEDDVGGTTSIYVPLLRARNTEFSKISEFIIERSTIET